VLQALPALPLQIADFNGDGLNDIILVSHDGLYGWAQVCHLPALCHQNTLVTLKMAFVYCITLFHTSFIGKILP
jgi:hypothetical protein